MIKRIVSGVVGVVGIGCLSMACSTETPASNESNIAIDPNTEDPAEVLGRDFEMTMSKVIAPGDVGRSFGLDDAHIPYPDTYWPFLAKGEDGKVLARNGIDDRWQGASEASPLEKFMSVVDPASSAQARDWEATNHGEKVKDVADWFGHCPGWTASAMVNAPLTKGVSVKNANGQLAECAEGSAGCTTFDVGDINALEAEVFLDSNGGFIGARCDTAPKDIPRDKNGRVLQAGCRGLNPGSLMVVLANRMKNVKNAPGFTPKAIAIDAQNEFNTDQIWNQPAYRYEVNEAQALSEQEAIKATHKASNGPLPAKYPFNANAKGWTRIDIGIKWVQENGPNRRFVSGKLSTQTMRFVAVLELDRDAKDPAARIVGGEFIDDPSVGATRLTVPPFVWTADGVKSDATANGHNPFVKGSIVEQLVALAAK